MAKIEYKTRGNSSPQGKPRVFVFFHQEDAVGKDGNQSSFDLVCADIFASQNCAIYYESEWDNPLNEEEMTSLLSEMQLFVMVISTNFLFKKDSQTIRAIYNIAEANQTPILPIAVEYGMENHFAEQMNSILSGAGDVQFLDRTANDPTKISYKEQLEKYLNSVIVGDELASRVRAAFDAYIFMSYRKKDRRYAQQLMRVIHNIPFCRDIAIWYDEYLIPGESWSDAIKDAMTKSSLVTLAVTPSLAEPNYIATHEYPYAKDLHKDIVLAEMQKTDRKLLEMFFEDMPVFVDGTDVHAMEKRLQQLATKINDESPEHNYLIGLAYLNAIDVERDTQRALKLIQTAAKAQLPEAIKKLVNMYNTGEGVKRDYTEAIKWQKKYISTIKKIGYNPQDIIAALLDLEDMEEAVGELVAAMGCGIKCMSMLSQILKDLDSNESWRMLSIIYTKLGTIRFKLGETDAAKEEHLKSLEIAKYIATNTGARDAWRDVSINYDRLCDIYKTEGYLVLAKSYCIKSLEIRKQLAEETDTIEVRRDLSISNSKLGDLYQAEGDLSAAKQYYSQSLQIDQQLAEEVPSFEAQRDLSVCYEKLGDIAQAENDLSGAKDYYAKSMEIRDNIVDNCHSLSAWRDLSVIKSRLGDTAKLEGDRKTAKEYFEDCYSIDKMLANTSQSLESKRAFAITCKKLGDINREEDNYEEAKIYYTMEMIIDQYLFDVIGIYETCHDLVVSYNSLGDIAQKQSDLSTAKEYLMNSLHIIQQMREKMAEKDTMEVWQDLSDCYVKLASIAEDEKDLLSAKNYYKKSFRLDYLITNENCTTQNLQRMAMICFHLGNVEQKEEHFAIAKKYFQKSLKILVPMSELGVKTATILSAMCYLHLSDIAKAEKDMVTANEYNIKHIELLGSV